MTKIIGIKIDTKSDKYKDKVYYYKTDEDLKRGDTVNVSVPSGGKPDAIVVIQDSQKKFNREIKKLN